MVLAFGFFWVQTIIYIGSVAGCENVQVGSSRDYVCDLMSPLGRIWILAGAPALVVLGGVWAQRQRQPRFLVLAFGAALLAGTALPMIGLEVTATR